MRKLFFLFLATVFLIQGCSGAEKKPVTGAAAVSPVSVQPSPAHQVSNSSIKIVVDAKNPEAQSYETADSNVGPSVAYGYGPGGAGIVYRKVPPMKVMGNGRVFNLYTDAKAPDNHYIPSGWMGDYGDLKINDRYSKNPHSGSTCIKIVYSDKATQGARWAGIYWQNPANNWGVRPGGYDLTGARRLTFWARGEKGNERIEEFKLGGITGEFGDSDTASIGPVVLTQDWQQYTISLEGKDLSSISGGFCWASNLDVNPEGATFYLDDIRYE